MAADEVMTTATQGAGVTVGGGEGLGQDALDVVGDVIAPKWAPSLEYIAALVPEHTKGKVSGSGENAGAPQLTFSDTTVPTAQAVEGWLVAAVNEVVGETRASLHRLERHPDLACTAVARAVIVEIIRSKGGRGMDDAQSTLSVATAKYLRALDSLKAAVQRVTPGLV